MRGQSSGCTCILTQKFPDVGVIHFANCDRFGTLSMLTFKFLFDFMDYSYDYPLNDDFTV